MNVQNRSSNSLFSLNSMRIFLIAGFISLSVISNLRASPNKVSFHKDIMPVLRKNCVACHSQSKAKGDLILESYGKIMEGIEGDAIVVPGKAKESILYLVSAKLEEPFMPPKRNKTGAESLTVEELKLLERWIDEGAEEGEKPAQVKGPDWHPLPEGLNPIYAIAVSPTGQAVACNRANQIFVYDLNNAEAPTRLTDPGLIKSGLYKKPGVAHRDIVHSLTFHPVEEVIVSGGYRTVKFWKRGAALSAGKLTSPKSTSYLTTVRELSGEKATWIAGYSDGHLSVFDHLANPPTRSWRLPSLSEISTLSPSADGKSIFIGTQAGSLIQQSIADQKELTKFENLPGAVTSLLSTQDSKLLVGTASGSVFYFDLSKKDKEKTISGSPPVSTLKSSIVTIQALGSAAQEVLIVDRKGSLVRLKVDPNHPDKSKPVWSLKTSAPVLSASTSADGERLGLTLEGQPAEIWDLKAKKRIKQLTVSQGGSTPLKSIVERSLKMAKAQQKEADRIVGVKEKDVTKKKDELKKAEEAFKAQEKKYNDQKAQLDKQSQELVTVETSIKNLDGVVKTQKAKVGDLKNKIKQSKQAISKASQNVKKTQDQLAKAKDKSDEIKTKLNDQLKKEQEGVKKLTEQEQKLNQELKDSEQKLKTANTELAQQKKKVSPLKNNVNKLKSELEKQKDQTEAASKPVLLRKESLAFVEKQLQESKKQAESSKAKSEKIEAELKGTSTKEVPKVANTSTPQWITYDGSSNAFIASFPSNWAYFDAKDGSFQKSIQKSPTAAQAQELDLLSSRNSAGVLSITRSGSWERAGAQSDWILSNQIGSGEGDSPFQDRILALAYSPKGNLLATAGGAPSRNGEVIIWNTTGELSQNLKLKDPHSDTVFALEFSSDGNYLATAGADKLVRIFDVKTGERLHSFEGHTHHALGVSWYHDGRYVASAGADNVVKIWDLYTGEQSRSIGGFGNQVTSLKFLGESQRTVACSGDKSVRIHQTNDGKQVRTLGGPQDYNYAISASWNGKVVAAGGFDSVLYVWNSDDGKSIKVLK